MSESNSEFGYVIYKKKVYQARLVEKKLDKVKLRVYYNDKGCPYHPVNQVYFNWFENTEFLKEEPEQP